MKFYSTSPAFYFKLQTIFQSHFMSSCQVEQFQVTSKMLDVNLHVEMHQKIIFKMMNRLSFFLKKSILLLSTVIFFQRSSSFKD